MATAQQSETVEILGKVDWNLYRDRRLMTLWKVAALSMGMTPKNPLIEQAKRNDSTWAKEYSSRKSYLCSKFSEVQTEGLVTYFSNYAGGNQDAVRASLTIDMLSAIEVLRKRYVNDMPEEFVALEADLKKIPLPHPFNVPLMTHVQVPFDQSSGKPSKEKSRNQTARNGAVLEDKMHIIIYAMAKIHYGYSAESRATDKKDSIDRMSDAISVAGYRNYGTGPSGIEDVLKEAYKIVLSKALNG